MDTHIPAMTALAGALIRHADGRWTWCDGTPEPRVEDLTLLQCAPNFRCATYGGGECVVEIPHDWRAAKYWPGRRVDAEAAKVIADMIIDGSARPAAIFAEGLAELTDDHRLRKHGYTLPIAVWDAAMGAICGVSWAKEHETDILGRAATLGEQDSDQP